MQREPMEFGTMRASRSNRRIAGSRPQLNDTSAAAVRDEAFAEFSRIDAGQTSAATPPTTRSLSRDLMADIASQLEALDRQRRQLARLLEGVEKGSAT